jgi:hypothetical protein
MVVVKTERGEMIGQTGLFGGRPIKTTAEDKPDQDTRPEPKKGGKRGTKNGGGHTIPAQMF